MSSKWMRAAAISMTIVLAACTSTDRDNAVIGGAAGAAIGGIGTGSLKGAAVGAAVGAGAGVLIGRVADSLTHCRYKDRRGRLYIARCR